MQRLRFDRQIVFSVGYWLIIALSLGLIFGSLARGQVNPPFATVKPTVPSAIGQPGVTLAWDTTAKKLVVTFTTANAQGAVSTLTTISYNPRALESFGQAGVVFSFAGVSVTLKHNLATDPLVYQIGTANQVLAQCATASPVPAGQVACPVIPF